MEATERLASAASRDLDMSTDDDDDAYVELAATAQSADQPEQPAAATVPGYRCLFCDDATSRDADDLIGRHLPEAHDDARLGAFLAEAGLREQSDWCQLVAYLRRPGASDVASRPARQQLDEFLTARRGRDNGGSGGDGDGADPLLLASYECDDPLMYEVDIDDLLGAAAVAADGGLVANKDPAGGDKDSRIRQLEEQVVSLRSQMAGMSALLRRLADDDGQQEQPPRTVAELSEDHDDYYVESYSGAAIHAEMLLDRVRTGAYHDFISGNPALFADRLVLDVGCGSGILSMFAARRGAACVLAVDCARVIEEAAAAAADNGLAGRISFHRGKLETLHQLRGANVDAIVSEWMGYFLLYEGMIESVLYARDHCLRPGGAVYPRLCTLRLCGLDSPELYHRHVLYFDDVCGVRLAYLRERGLSEAHVTFDLRPEWVATDSAELRTFDMLAAQPEDTRFTAGVGLTASRDCVLHALAGYFDADFLGPGDPGANVAFSTGPLAQVTHWGQTLFCLRRPIRLARGEGLALRVTVGQPEGHPRGLCVSFELPDGAICRYAMK